MSYPDEVRPAEREPLEYDAQMEFRRDVESQRITAAQREQLRTVARDILRQNAGRDLSPVFAESDPAPRVVLAGIAIEEYLASLGYPAPTGRMASTLREQERAAARHSNQALQAAVKRVA